MANDNGAARKKKITPTGQRLLDVLRDGRPHSYTELFGVMDLPPGWVADADGYVAEYAAAKTALQCHISELRAFVAPKGMDIVCQFMNKTKRYRLMRVISADE